MNSEEYVAAAIRTESVPASLEVNQFVFHDLMTMILNLGTVADLVKKRLFYGKPIDGEKMGAALDEIHVSVERQEEILDFTGSTFMDFKLSSEDADTMNPEVAKSLGSMGDISKVNVRLLHCALGIFTESAEMFEALHRQYIGEPFDMVNFAEELGDADWYKAIGHDETGISEQELREKNIAKLRKRYPEKFTNENAISRDLKAERAILESGVMYGGAVLDGAPHGAIAKDFMKGDE